MPLEGSKAMQSITTDLDFVGDNQGTVPSRALDSLLATKPECRSTKGGQAELLL